MLTNQELDEAREDLEAELVDEVTVRVEDGPKQTDPDTLESFQPWTVLATEVPALVVRSSQAERVVAVGDEPVTLYTHKVTVPIGTPAAGGIQILVTASHDPETQGVELRVKEVGHGSLSISRRLLCQQEA